MTGDGEIAAFVAQAGLPARFADLAARLHAPLAARIAQAAAGRNEPLVVGLCGPQGAGKSTLVALVTRLLRGRGLKTANLSLDDLYLTRAERLALGQAVHPLLRTRGVPGTHDIGLGLGVLDALARPARVLLPRFDKAVDDRAPVADFECFEAPVEVILLEGWCLGARAQPEAALVEPVNTLERDEDPAGLWRRRANAALAGPYRALFDRIDLLVVMTAPDFATVRAWRGQQEQRLREDLAAHGRDPALAMDDAALDRFVAHYQRLTEWIACDLPSRADIAIRLDANREPVETRGL
ncbi:kinase [Caulobacter sp. DWR1-3-2b1]|uniref:kinase n=1 Tax=Caulobacter sp. DWR1-3-2b1 TaxID=2804670 RepID=UPI003CEF9C2D